MDLIKSIASRRLLKAPVCLLSLVVSVLLYSCATVGETGGKGDTHVIKGVPFFPQKKYQCGPASLAMVLNFWGTDVTPGDIAREIFSRTAGGALNMDMVLYANKKGLRADQYSGNPDDLKKNIDSGLPVIVLVDYGFAFYQVNHFMVVVGYNGREVIVNSGRRKDAFISWKDFLKPWEKTGCWTLLIRKS